MKAYRLLTFLCGATSLIAAFLVACGDDDVVITNDAGLEGSVPDGGFPPPDTGSDAGADVTPVPIADYAGLVADALCSAVTRCCFGDANVQDGGAVDGGTYNAAACHGLYRDLGFEYSNIGANVFDAGGVVLDQDKAHACLDQVKSLPCSLQGAKLENVRAQCFDAVVGQRTLGQPCRASVECVKGSFCDSDGGVGGAGDGGIVGTCATLRGLGGKCGVFNSGNVFADSENSEEACSTRGGGDTDLRCDSYDFDAGDAGEYRDRAEWTCQPTVAVGEGCNSTVWCEEGICDVAADYLCKSPLAYFDAVCDNVLNP